MSARARGVALACGLLALLPLSGAAGVPWTAAGSTPEPRAAEAHELHLAYGDLAVEGTVIARVKGGLSVDIVGCFLVGARRGSRCTKCRR